MYIGTASMDSYRDTILCKVPFGFSPRYLFTHEIQSASLSALKEDL